MSEKLDKKINYKEHVFRFIFVTVILFLINLIFSPNHWWFYWPMAIVAIILIGKFIKVRFIDE